ncbi:MAG: hemerythrin domain-containing protein [Rubrivivax sp.]|nr:hemerythrin domain-containing protein [Rubrivivax sp.]
MSTLTWTDALVLDHGRMDRTHREFVDLVADVEHALNDDPELLPGRFASLLSHTEAHFAQEERWMQQLGFAEGNCHAFQHQHVLDVLREVQRIIGTTGDAAIVRRLTAELGSWFVAHAQMMDAALAETMAQHGLDAETGAVARPPAPQAELVTSCGSASCS